MNQILMNFAENLLLQLVMGLQLGRYGFFRTLQYHFGVVIPKYILGPVTPNSASITHQILSSIVSSCTVQTCKAILLGVGNVWEVGNDSPLWHSLQLDLKPECWSAFPWDALRNSKCSLLINR